jgi:hypothetical protein
MYIYENEFLKLQTSDLPSIWQVQTDGIRTCIFVAAKYNDGTRGFAHIDAFTTQDAIKRFLNNASDIKIAYTGEEYNVNYPNRKQYAQEQYNALEAKYAATPQAGKKYSSLLSSKDSRIEIFNIASALKEVEDDVKVTVDRLQKDRIKCAYNITTEEMTCEECPREDASYKYNAIKHQDGLVYKSGWQEAALNTANIRHKVPRISVLQNNALVSKTLDTAFPLHAQPAPSSILQHQHISRQVKVVAKDDVTKLKDVLRKLRKDNADLAKLSVAEVLEIFHDASENKYYTNRKPQLPLDVSGNSRTDKDAVLMRKFSVEFQNACKNQGLNFSNTNKSGNANGMRTKSVVAFLEKNNGGDIETLVKSQWRQ